MHQLLKNTVPDAPGALSPAPPTSSVNSTLPSADISTSASNSNNGINNNSSSGDSTKKPFQLQRQNLKQNIDEQKRNTRFQFNFSLPLAERLISEERAAIWMIDNQEFGKFFGKLYLGSNFLCFQSYNHNEATFTMPYYAIRKLERINTASQIYAITITTISDLRYSFQFGTDRLVCERVCDVLKDRLKECVPLAKQIKPMLADMPSEVLLDGRHVDSGGFGLQFGFPGDQKKLKDKTKTKYWLSYFRENGRHLALFKNVKFYRLIRIGLPSILRSEVWEVCSGALWERLQQPDYYEGLLRDHEG
jgi:hypothetical protein